MGEVCRGKHNIEKIMKIYKKLLIAAIAIGSLAVMHTHRTPDSAPPVSSDGPAASGEPVAEDDPCMRNPRVCHPDSDNPSEAATEATASAVTTTAAPLPDVRVPSGLPVFHMMGFTRVAQVTGPGGVQISMLVQDKSLSWNADGSLHLRTASMFDPPMIAPNLNQPVAIAYEEADIDCARRRYKGDEVENTAVDNSTIESHTLRDDWTPYVEHTGMQPFFDAVCHD
jgi:hypothetical protein